MSMSTHVVAIRPPDERWRRMQAVYEAAKNAGIPVPPEVDRFFDGEAPDPEGVILHLDSPSVTEWADGYRQGLEVVLSELPPDVKILRFYNSW